MHNIKNQKEAFSFHQAFVDLSKDLPERSRRIVERRFGMTNQKQVTLEAIGRHHGITRERVRQIIRSSTQHIHTKKKEVPYQRIQEKITYAIEKNSGIIKEHKLFIFLQSTSAQERGAVRFFVTCLDTVGSVDTKKYPMCDAVALQNFDFERWHTLHHRALNTFRQNKESFTIEDFSRALSHRDSQELENFFTVSSEIGQNVFARWGLASWGEITPRGMREKIHLVLKQQKKPLHFRAIAKLIDHYGLAKNGRTAHPQTVHNELIKDPRFVLVGRGVYALAVWGYKTGTVKDVVGDILAKQKVPMATNDILREVLLKRQVKKSTVMINLNTFFQKIGADQYTLKS